MSGGSYDYACFKVNDMARSLEGVGTDPRRAAFQKLLRLIGKAMYDIEWVDSSDYGDGDDHASIDACFAFMGADPAFITKAHAYDALTDMLRKFLPPAIGGTGDDAIAAGAELAASANGVRGFAQADGVKNVPPTESGGAA